MPLTGLVRIPAGDLLMGGSSEQIEACIANWATRLVDPLDDLARFRQWILKEHPRHLARVTCSRLGRDPHPAPVSASRLSYRPGGRPLSERPAASGLP